MNLLSIMKEDTELHSKERNLCDVKLYEDNTLPEVIKGKKTYHMSGKKNARTILLLVVMLFALTGCGKNAENQEKSEAQEKKDSTILEHSIENSIEDSVEDTSEQKVNILEASDLSLEAVTAENSTVEAMEWESYFKSLNGAAVFYNPKQNHYQIYNSELAEVRRSPCSTFKIVSSLIGLKEGIIKMDNSVRTWSGENFWKEEWNKDIDFEEAFRTSCVWYFREMTNEVEPKVIQEELNALQYGNCDITDWKGEQNKNNNNPSLRGFWIESSLLISPKEQATVLARIFQETSEYPKDITDALKKVMLWTEEPQLEVKIYGKTGMGKVDGKTVDAWYVGFFTEGEEDIFFATYLGKSEDVEVSSKLAREIAQNIIADKLAN